MPRTTSIVDYQVLFDGGNFPLDESNNERRIFKFEVPSDIIINASGARKPIIGFKVFATQDSTNVEVYLNIVNPDFKIVDAVFQNGYLMVYWEAFSFLPALNNFPNPVDVIFNCTRGACEISDVIVWYQINRDS